VGELLELVGLPSHYAHRNPAALSGGEQQRVTLARALAPDPAVVLLDEPFSALDAGLRAGLRAAVAASLKRVRATALLVTHDQDEALSMGDQVAVLQNGRLAQVAAPQALYRFPVNREIARFVGEAVLVAGSVKHDRVECCFGRLPLAPEAHCGRDGAVDVLIRPEQFLLCGPQSSHDTNGSTAQTARVEQLRFYGHDAQVTLQLHHGLRFTATVPGYDLPATGQCIRFRITGNVVAYPRQPKRQDAGMR
jgi:iron(III) transport system ATP-binding protein